MSKLKDKFLVMFPDSRGVEPHPYGAGNLKLGLGVLTYSRLAGDPAKEGNPGGTCPGSTDECERICYAKRMGGLARYTHERNGGDIVPAIPADCQILRIHVSGDFDTVEYISNWIYRLEQRPDVTAWAYTRSWRVYSLLPWLEILRKLPNMQLFASMDKSHNDVPPTGWRRAWIDGDVRAGEPILRRAHSWPGGPNAVSTHNLGTFDGERTYVCPEETGRKQDCLSCGYCFEGRKHDVTFLEH